MIYAEWLLPPEVLAPAANNVRCNHLRIVVRHACLVVSIGQE